MERSAQNVQRTCQPLGPVAVRVRHVHGIVETVGKKIVAMRSSANACQFRVNIDKPPELRVIIAAVEIVQPRLGVVIVPPVAEGILIAHGVAGSVGDGTLAPGVVAVLSHDLSRCGAGDGNDIPLQVVEVVEQHGPVGEAHALAGAVVEEPHDRIPGLLRQNLGAVEEKLRSGAVHCLAGADTVGVVLIAVGVAAAGDLPQLTAHPGVGGAVVAGHVANAVVGDGLAVVLGQQVRPAAVAVGISYLRLSCFAINKIFISSFTLVAL